MKFQKSFNNPYRIQVLEKLFHILDILCETGHPLNLKDLSERSQTPKSTVFRIVTNLLQAGYLTESPDGYWLGLELLRLGHAVERKLDVQQIATPFLAQLRDQTNETVYLAALTNNYQIQYLQRAVSNQAVTVSLSDPGTTATAYCTALGKTMLAYLPEEEADEWLLNTELTPVTPNSIADKKRLRAELARIRERGYATDDEECKLTICCIAAPIFDINQRVVAAISVAGPNTRMPQPLVNSQIAEHVTHIARQISLQMGLPAAE